MAWVERRLFVFGEEVIRIAVKHHFPDPLYRNQRLGDQLGGIEQIEVKRLFILFRDQLQTQLILRIIAGFYRFPQIAAMEIRIPTGQLLRLIPEQRGFTGQRFPVKTDKGGLTVGIDQAEGVNTKSFHSAIAARYAAVGHRPHHVM